MGGEIAQVDRLRRHPRRAQGRRSRSSSTPGSTKARRGHRGPARPSWSSKEKITQERRRRPARGGHRAASRARTDYEGFGDVDFVIEAVPERMEIKQAVFAELDAAHARATRSSPPTPRRCRSPRWARPRLRPDKVVRLPLLLPGVGDAPDRGDRGRGHLRGDAARPRPTSPRRSARQPIRCGEVPGFVVNRILNSRGVRGLARDPRGGRSTSRR